MAKARLSENKIKFRAIRDFIVIKVVEATTTNGIIIPDQAKEMALYGEAVSVGCGLVEGGVVIPLVVRPGDQVRFLPHSGTKMTIDGETVYVLRENQVFGVYDK